MRAAPLRAPLTTPDAQVVILFSLGVWFILWGTVGAVLAVPLTSVLRIIANYLHENRVGMPHIAVAASILEGRSLDVGLNERDADSVAGRVSRSLLPAPTKSRGLHRE